jgi:excisionase family DNA binding protein
MDMESTSSVLTIEDVARELRCSKAHVRHAMRGRVAGVARLTHVTMGRRRLIRREWLDEWLEVNRRK